MAVAVYINFNFENAYKTIGMKYKSVEKTEAQVHNTVFHEINKILILNTNLL